MSHDDTSPDAFGTSLAARVLPRTRVARRSPASDRPGALAGRIAGFAASLAAPSFSHVGIEPSTLSDPSHQNVRPPIDSWLWGEAEQPEPDAAPRRAARITAPPDRAVRRAPRKGLPLTTRRKQNTLGGARTAPGAIARTLLPNTDTSAPIEAASVLRRARRNDGVAQTVAARTPRPATPAAATPAAEPAGLPSDLQRLQRMLIRDGKLQPRDPSGEPLVPPPSVTGARPATPAARPTPAPSPSPSPGREPGAGPAAEPGVVRRVAETAPRASAEGRIDRHTVSASRARRDAQAPTSRVDEHTVASRPSPFAAPTPASPPPPTSQPPITSQPSASASASASPSDAASAVAPPRPVAPQARPAGAAPEPSASRSPERTTSVERGRRDPIVRRNADFGRPGPATAPSPSAPRSDRPSAAAPGSPSRGPSTPPGPAVVDRAALDRIIAARPGAATVAAPSAPNASQGAVLRRSAVPVERSLVAEDRSAAQPADGILTPAARQGIGDLAVAPASAIAVAERPAADVRDRTIAPAPARPETASRQPARDAMDAARATPLPALDPSMRDADIRSASPDAMRTVASPADVARREAGVPTVDARRPAAPPPAEVVRRRADASASSPVTDERADPRTAAREGVVVRRLGEMSERPDAAALPVRPAVALPDAEQVARAAPDVRRGPSDRGATPVADAPVVRRSPEHDAPSDRGTTPVANAPVVRRSPEHDAPSDRGATPVADAPVVRRSPEHDAPSDRGATPVANAPVVRRSPEHDAPSDRVTAADLGRLRSRTVRPGEPVARAAAPTPSIMRAPARPVTDPPADVTSRLAPAAPAGVPDVVRRSVEALQGSAPGAVPTADDGHRPARSTDAAVRPPVAVDRAADRAADRGVAPGATAASTTITRALLRRTLAAREPVRRRVAPLANAGLAAGRTSSAEPASHASAIEAAVHAAPDADAAPQPIAERFMTELSRQRAPRPRPLPAQFHEMSHVIAGTPQVRVSTDTISRQALRSVGKVAATVDDVIHLDRPIGSVRPDVIAHELTHVAHRSPEPRFFDDDRPSREESRAEAVAKVMRSSAAPSIVRRSPGSGGGAPGRTSEPGTVSAEALAARLGGADSNTIRREPDWTATRPRSERRTPQIGSARGTAAPATPVPVPAESPSSGSTTSTADPGGFRIEEHFDRIVELLQDRVLAELERRGGRLRGGF